MSGTSLRDHTTVARFADRGRLPVSCHLHMSSLSLRLAVVAVVVLIGASGAAGV
jgi:hypothetical protein